MWMGLDAGLFMTQNFPACMSCFSNGSKTFPRASYNYEHVNLNVAQDFISTCTEFCAPLCQIPSIAKATYVNRWGTLFQEPHALRKEINKSPTLNDECRDLPFFNSIIVTTSFLRPSETRSQFKIFISPRPNRNLVVGRRRHLLGCCGNRRKVFEIMYTITIVLVREIPRP